MMQSLPRRGLRAGCLAAVTCCLVCLLALGAGAANGPEMSTAYPGLLASAGDSLSFAMDFDNTLGSGQNVSMVASSLAASLYPLDGIEGLFNMEANYNLELTVNRISPYYLFSEAASTILNPNVRSIGVVTMSQLSGAVAGYLPFGQSLLLVWPHVVCMIALTAVCFGASYVAFMRQEIRA